MRQAAENANVSWSYKSIVYKKAAIGYSSPDADDANLISNELEKLLGYPAQPINEPTTNINPLNQTQ
jgi:hypothetical protein